MDEVNRQDLEAFLEHLYFKSSNSNSSRRLKLVAIASFWRFLVYERLVDEDITILIPKPNIKRNLVQVFSQGEVLAMFATMDPTKFKGLRDISLLVLMAFGGLRREEAVTLTLGNLLDDETYIDVEVIDSKRGSRTVDFWKAPSMIIRQLVMWRLSQGATEKSPIFVNSKKVQKGRFLILNDLCFFNFEP